MDVAGEKLTVNEDVNGAEGRMGRLAVAIATEAEDLDLVGTLGTANRGALVQPPRQIDDAVSSAFLATLAPAGLEASLHAVEQLGDLVADPAADLVGQVAAGDRVHRLGGLADEAQEDGVERQPQRPATNDQDLGLPGTVSARVP